jgi:hypothetical protein
VKQLLDYISTQQEAIITYRANDMLLSVHSIAGYCNKKKGTKPSRWPLLLFKPQLHPPEQQNNPYDCNNHQKCDVISGRSRTGGPIPQCKRVYVRQILREMGHPQPPTPIQTDNTIVEGVVNNIAQPKHTKAMNIVE